jgi:hypothetical protein
MATRGSLELEARRFGRMGKAEEIGGEPGSILVETLPIGVFEPVEADGQRRKGGSVETRPARSRRPVPASTPIDGIERDGHARIETSPLHPRRQSCRLHHATLRWPRRDDAGRFRGAPGPRARSRAATRRAALPASRSRLGPMSSAASGRAVPSSTSGASRRSSSQGVREPASGSGRHCSAIESAPTKRSAAAIMTAISSTGLPGTQVSRPRRETKRRIGRRAARRRPRRAGGHPAARRRGFAIAERRPSGLIARASGRLTIAATP